MRRLAFGATIALAALFLHLPAGPVEAQGYPRYFDGPSRDERGERGRRYDDDANFQRRLRYYRRDEVARRESASRRRVDAERQERRRSGFSVPFFDRLFGRSEEVEEPGYARRAPDGVEVRPAPRRIPRRPAPPPAAARPAAPAPAQPAVAAAPEEKVEATTFVAVFGDSIADGLAGGLEEGFSDAPEVGVRRHVKANAGLVRVDYHDFVEEAKRTVASGEKIDYAVIDVGVNDRQPFLDIRHAAPLSEEWTERYRQRVDAMLAPFKERKIPVFWVGLAPSESRRASADHATLNDLIRERVEAAGGTFVDVWEAFVDEAGEYAAFGPQLDGQMGRLRLDDGVHFSRTGSRKLSHYAEREIRKTLKPRLQTPEAMIGAVTPDADAEVTPLLGPDGVDKPRPLSSPVVVLTSPRKAAGGALAAAAPVPAANVAPDAERVLLKGETLDAAPGRLDDARWPGSQNQAGIAAGGGAPGSPPPTAAAPAPERAP